MFAAGAGPGSGAERKVTMDRDGAIKLLDASGEAGVGRYVVVSAVGAESPPDGADVFSVYLRAKAEADEAVMASDSDWVIVRPGGLTERPRHRLRPHRRDPVPRPRGAGRRRGGARGSDPGAARRQACALRQRRRAADRKRTRRRLGERLDRIR